MTRRAQAYPDQAVDLFHAATERAQGQKVEMLRATGTAYRVRLEVAAKEARNARRRKVA